MLRSEPENCALPSSVMPARRPTSLTPRSVSALRSRVGAVGRAGELQRRHPSRPRDVVDLVVALVVHAGGVHPPLHVLAAIDARRADVLADRRASPGGPSAGSRRRSGCRSPTRRPPARRRRRAGRDCDSDCAVSVATDGGTRSAKAGTRAMLHAPVASTTVRQRQSPLVGAHEIAVVRRCAPTSPLCASCTGAEIALA